MLTFCIQIVLKQVSKCCLTFNGKPYLKQEHQVYWTNFFDRDNPSGAGDWETLSDLKKQYPGQICDSPIEVEGQLYNER